MARIQLLEKSVYELIAAGEVTDRPASVVKELIENSVDAGATNITVEIKNGGISYIRVTDNGTGIEKDDIPVAFIRHATSKVRQKEDLENIHTLGFRGEALASVSAVSKVELLTKTQDSPIGYSYTIQGDEAVLEPCGCPDGTTLVIRDLFYNTPARLKFLKKEVTEGNYIQSVVDKLALSNPHIAFQFIRDNKTIRVTAGDGKLYSAIYGVYGKQFAASLIPADYSYNGIHVTGYVSSPLFARTSRSMQVFFVNGRYIKSPMCTSALEEGYRNSLTVGKFPACILNIQVPANSVDVNVHPAKTEVRFENEKIIFDAVYFASKNAILNAENSRDIIIPVIEKATEHTPPVLQLENEMADYKLQKEYTFIQQYITPKQQEKAITFATTDDIKCTEHVTNTILFEEQEFGEKPEVKQETVSGFRYIEKSAFEKPIVHHSLKSEENTETKPLRVIGELFKTYILCESDSQLVLIDKHAAHERIRFETLKKDFVAHSQLLSEQKRILVTPEEHALLCEHKEKLSEIGIDLLPVENSFVEIYSLPAPLVEKYKPEEILQKVINALIGGTEYAQGELFDDLLHSVACKSAIRANEDTSMAELTALAQQVWADESIRFCPHGRPIILKLSKSKIESFFDRS